jgi:hypothetical protein
MGSVEARKRVECPAWPECGCGTQSGPHTCEWRDECWRRYREAGINILQTAATIDLMNAIDDEVTKEWEERRK